jgi:PBP1b-binding outer membrane lipoprotein LpoB
MAKQNPKPQEEKPKGKRGRKLKFTSAEIIQALDDAYGIQASAARALGMGRSTMVDYIARDPKIKAAYEQINETTIDRVENKLLQQIDAGNITAIIFYLKTKAKSRGYIEFNVHAMKEINKPITWKEFIESTIIDEDKKEDPA